MEKLDRLIAEYTGGREVDPNADLMGRPVLLTTYNMAYLFLDIEKEFSIDLNQLVPRLTVYSPKEIADRLSELCSHK